MTQDPFASFDLIRIINLPERTDRRREMLAELARIGLNDDPRIGFVDGMRPKEMRPFRSLGEKGVFLSHLKILQEAAAANASVLILEDDADFTSAALVGTAMPSEGISYGGYEAGDPANLHSSDIVGAHCMGFSMEQAKLLVPYLTTLLDHSSPPPIDGAYVWYRRAFPGVPTHFAVPPMAVQRASRSDIAARRFFDRLPGLREAAGMARRFKRSLTKPRKGA